MAQITKTLPFIHLEMDSVIRQSDHRSIFSCAKAYYIIVYNSKV